MTPAEGGAGSDPPEVSTGLAGPDGVVLIGYQDQGNLGMGYLAGMLHERGRPAVLVDVRDGPERITERLVADPPLVVGFSLIFQFFLPQFRAVATSLREAGISSHFTIGGHYASLCPDEVLVQFPELDSVVRFEGEETVVELADHLAAGGDWRSTPGLAFLRGGEMTLSEPRALVHDLDTLPLPYRIGEADRIAGFRTLPLLASRGCARRCSFCSIHTFYRTAPGKVVRVRRPERIVDEMVELYQQRCARIFLFQDDDFPLWGRAGRRWVDELVGRMYDAGLAERSIWKISCRAEYVEPELFARLRDAGLFLVYMGIESGVEQGLEILHKQLTVEENLAGVRTLKELGVWFSYGFMLFDPSSDFESVRDNIAFLRAIVGDGYAAATFCRMLPYGGTPIRERLAAEGRLRGNVTHPDYDFLDSRLYRYYHLQKQVTKGWIHNTGLSHEFNWAWEELETIRRLVDGVEGIERYRSALATLTAESNETLFGFVEQSSAEFEASGSIRRATAAIEGREEALRAQLVELRDAFLLANLAVLVDAVESGSIRGPVMAPQVH